jgi:PAS domain S-box-containing protein
VLVPEDRTLLDDRAGEILGISGRSIPRAAAFGKIHPDDAVRVRGESERSLRARTPLLISYRLLRRDDDLRHVVVAGAFLYDDAGEAIEICGVVFDVTERREVEEALRESEARVRRVIEQAPFPIAIHAEDGTAVLINDAWCSRSGYERAEIATLEAWAERAGGNRAEEICAQARELYAKDEPMYLGLAAVATKSGEERIWELRFAPVGQLPDGRRIFVTMAADVTERDLARDLARSNHELEQFAYVASHDLQEPLRMVASYVQLLEQRYKGKLDETADKYIHYAVDGATRMRGLINDLLDYSRAGRGEVPDTPVSAAELLDDVQRNLRMRIEEAQAQLTCDALPDLRGNRSELTLIFQNLIDNALKYRGQAPVRVHVGCDGAEEPGRARFSVRDNGIGFEPQHAERIFRPFQRLHDRSQYSGNGIGLALVQRIVGRYGGRVWAESTPGQGSTFRFTLPIAARKE